MRSRDRTHDDEDWREGLLDLVAVCGRRLIDKGRRFGEQIPAHLVLPARGGLRIPLDVKGLPYGVRVLDIGLNGILLTERDSEREVAIYCEPWVAPMDHPFVVLARREGKNTEHAARSVLLKVKK